MTVASQLVAADLAPLLNSAALLSILPTCFNVRGYGAVGDGVTDDSASVNAAIDAAIAAYGSGNPCIVYFPSGKYRIVTPHAVMRYPISFVGDGHFKSVILVDTTFSGTLFAWSDVWQGGAQTGTTFALLGGSPADRSGVRVSGLTIIGDRSTSNTQNAFIFYDRADFVCFDDVSIWFMKGRGFYNGVLLNVSQSYMRESHFHNFRMNGCGDTSTPAWEMSSEGGVSTDATNEVHWYNLNVVNSFGPSAVIRNNGPSTVRYMNFYGCRLEGNNVDDLLQIGDATFAGAIDNIKFFGAQFIGAPSGKSGIHTLAPNSTAGNNITNVYFEGLISNNVGKGLNIQAGRQLWFKITTMNSTDTNLTVGPTSQGVGKLTIDSGVQGQIAWTVSIDVSMNFNINMPQPLFGKPTLVSGFAYSGNGTPEGAVAAIVGSTYHRTDGGTSTSFYVKETGSSNTGWIAK